MSNDPVGQGGDDKALKAIGIIREKVGDLFSIRVRVVGGHLGAEHLQAAGNLANQYGRGCVHLTTRQGIEIPHVRGQDLEALQRDLAGAGLALARGGSCVRGITACPGSYCRAGLIDTQHLAQCLDDRVGQRGSLPHKFKIAVTGCPNSCTKPQENDLGFMGTAKGVAVFVGGKMGKNPRLGDRLPFTLSDHESLLAIADAVIDWYAAHGAQRERFGSALDRVGVDRLIEHARLVREKPAALHVCDRSV